MSDIVIAQNVPVPTDRVGTADIIGFGQEGVVILRNSIQPQSASVINNFGYNAGGWRVEKHVRLVGDTTGKGRADIVGFGENAVWVALNNGNNTFGDPQLVLQDFSYSAGWRVEKHIRFVADISKTGRADIVGFGDAGVFVSQNKGKGSFGAAQLALNDFGYNAGWRIEKHLRFLADTTGDGLPDIVGFGENSVFIAVNNGNGTFKPVKSVVHDMCYGAGGWRIEKHPRTMFDLNGDGLADLIGFGDAGVYISLNTGNNTFGPVQLAVKDFGYNAGGWRVEKHPRFIADVTPDGCGDIVGFGDAGVYVAINNGDGTFQPPKLVIKDFGYVAGGWRVEKHLRFPVDITGDGAADIIGFGETAVYVSYNDGKGNFGPVEKLVDNFAFSGGWSLDKTVRYVANLYR